LDGVFVPDAAGSTAMPRLFTGIELPSAVRQQLASLKAPLPGVRWLEPENFHLTLRFAGDIDNPSAREFAEELARIEMPAFSLRLSGLGVFGSKDPHTLWAGVEPNPLLSTLAQANETAARHSGLAINRRKFTPHVTVARLRYPRVSALARYLNNNSGFRSRTFDVTDFVLFSARPRTGGGPYAVEERFALHQPDYHDMIDEFED
jgi:RNA 2',3'-cyclic 3'-phosphodiesterase